MWAGLNQQMGVVPLLNSGATFLMPSNAAIQPFLANIIRPDLSTDVSPSLYLKE